MTYWLEILPPIVEGFKISLFVYAVTMVFALPIGMGFGLLADIVKPSRKFIAIFTWIIRGTPLLLQLYITMYAIHDVSYSFDHSNANESIVRWIHHIHHQLCGILYGNI